MTKPVNYRFQIPQVTPKRRVCVILEVPDEETHFANLWGVISQLGRVTGYEDTYDSAQQDLQRQAATAWLEALISAKVEECELPAHDFGGLSGDNMCCCIRFNPDTGKFQMFSCGAWTDIPGQPAGGIFAPPQPGGGSPQPPPGGCASYHGQVVGNFLWNIPTLVNAGDVVTITNAVGTSNQSPNLLWQCPDGNIFFADCVPNSAVLSGLELLPTAPVGALIAVIGGTYYPVMDTPLTVPGGVSNAQIQLLINHDPGSGDVNGSYTVDVQICNNQESDWSHTLQFAVSPQGFTFLPAYGITVINWLAGQGFSYTDNAYRGIGVEFDSASPTLHLTHLDMTYDLTLGGHTGGGDGTYIAFAGTPVAGVIWSAQVDGNDQHLVWDGDQSGITALQLFVGISNAGYTGDGLIKTLAISGKGYDPFA